MKKYTDEQVAWLREYAPGKFTADIIGPFNERFGLNITRSQLHSLMGNHNIRNDMYHKCRHASCRRITTDRIDQAVLAEFHHKGKGSYKDVQNFLLVRYGLLLSDKQIKSYASRIGLCMQVYGHFPKGHVPANKGKRLSPEVYAKCKPTMFKKGHLPHNWQPVGSERFSKDGYLEVKVTDPNVWVPKHRLIYEQATGEKLSKQDVIIFLDGNMTNLVPENLAKVSKAELARLNQNHLLNKDREISKAGIAIAKLITATATRERGDKK